MNFNDFMCVLCARVFVLLSVLVTISDVMACGLIFYGVKGQLFELSWTDCLTTPVRARACVHVRTCV